MKHFLFLLTVITFLSCNQNHDAPNPALTPTQKALMAHTWIYDSIYSGDSIKRFSEPKDKLVFGVATYAITHNGSTGSTYYETGDSNKIYYWSKEEKKDVSRYIVIKQLNDTSFIEYDYPPERVTVISYHHAE